MSYNGKLQSGVDEFRREVHDGELDPYEIASWLFHQGRLAAPAKDQIALLAKDVSTAMRTQTEIDPKGRRVRKKHCVRSKYINEAGKIMVQSTWFDKEIAGWQFMEESFAQRRNGIADRCFQLKQDVDHYNDFKNPGDGFQMPLNFTDDVAEKEYSGEYPTLEEDFEDEEDQKPSPSPTF